MSKYIVQVHIGNCVSRGYDWIPDTWYYYNPEEYHEYTSYEEALKTFEKIDLQRYRLPSKRKFIFKEIIVPVYGDNEEKTEIYKIIDYESRFFKDWIDG